MIYFRLIIIITSIVAVINNNVSYDKVVMLCIATIISIILTRKYPFHKNYGKYLVWFVYWTSVIFMPAFHIVMSISSFYTTVTPQLNNDLLNFGIPIYLFSSIVVLVTGLLFEKRVTPTGFTPVVVPVQKFRNIILVCFFLSIVGYVTGISRMGGEVVVLPFHLGGIINLFRKLMMPILFAIIVEGYILAGLRIPKEMWVYYIAWAFMEIFSWLSKSILVTDLIPVLFLLFMYYRPSMKSIIRTTGPMVAVFLFLYPIVEGMRSSESGTSLMESFTEARGNVESSVEEVILKPINRTFMFGLQYAQDKSYINESDFFDFSKTPLLLSMGGAENYQTFFIDGYPPESHNSSGTTGLMDPILHGGKGLMYIVILLICILAGYTDQLLKKGYYSIVITLLMLLMIYTRNANVSTLYNSTGVQTLFVYALCIYLSYRYNYKNKIN